MTIRTFIAVDVEVTDNYKRFQESLKSTGARLKLTDAKNLHLTLKFLGDIEEDTIHKIEKAMFRSVSGMQPIQAKLRGTGIFPNEQKIRVIWIGVEGGESILDIEDSLEEELEEYGFEREDRAYVPHLTVARTKFDRKRGPNPNISKLMPVVEKFSEEEFGTLTIDKIKLMKSVLTPQGPVYSVVTEVPFF